MSEPEYLLIIMVLLAAAVVTVPLFNRLGLGSVLGYLVAGVLLGPAVLGVIEQVDEIRHLAEFGVIFLLFIIGIEMKPARLWVMRRLVFGLGLGQLLITGSVLTGLALMMSLPPRSAIVVGFSLALSSTAFGLQILAEKGSMTSPAGRTAFSVLLLQDLAVVPLLALVSLLEEGMPLGLSLGGSILEAILIITGMLLAGRYLLNPLLALIAASRNSEVFISAAVLLVLGMASLMELAGLSMALGAFLAGMMLAESHYRHQIEADIQPFRGILLGLFFMSVGMGIDFGLLLDSSLLIIALVFGLLSIKAFLLWGLCRLMKIGQGDALRVSLLLSQSGEFAFVLFGVASLSGLLAAPHFQLLTLVVALSMAATPLVVALGDRLARRMDRPSTPKADIARQLKDAPPHVLLAGFGRVGRRLAALMNEAQIPFVALDMDHERVAEGRALGYPVFYGNASRLDVLKAAGAAQARLLVVALDNVANADSLVAIAHEHFPRLPIHVRARDRQHCNTLRKYGASSTVSETLESSLRLGEQVLTDSGIPTEQANRILEDFRKGYYAQR